MDSVVDLFPIKDSMVKIKLQFVKGKANKAPPPSIKFPPLDKGHSFEPKSQINALAFMRGNTVSTNDRPLASPEVWIRKIQE